MDRYRIKLMPVTVARPDQQCNGYLAYMGRTMEYNRSDALKRARIFGGMLKKVQPEDEFKSRS